MKEITLDDPFGAAIARYTTGKNLGLEVGGGTGEGSTTCIRTEMLFSIENCPDRARQHAINVTALGHFPVYGTATMPGHWMSWNEVCAFHASGLTQFSSQPIETVRSWYELSLSEAAPFKYGAIRALAHKLARQFDFVLIDGGPFSARAELNEIARYLVPRATVALDDVNDIKNYHNYHFLMDHATLLWENNDRNGAAIFKLG